MGLVSNEERKMFLELVYEGGRRNTNEEREEEDEEGS